MPPIAIAINEYRLTNVVKLSKHQILVSMSAFQHIETKISGVVYDFEGNIVYPLYDFVSGSMQISQQYIVGYGPHRALLAYQNDEGMISYTYYQFGKEAHPCVDGVEDWNEAEEDELTSTAYGDEYDDYEYDEYTIPHDLVYVQFVLIAAAVLVLGYGICFWLKKRNAKKDDVNKGYKSETEFATRNKEEDGVNLFKFDDE